MLQISSGAVSHNDTWQAVDLGERLLRAFDTPTGMPRCRVNLKSGIPKAPTEA